ncbi:MAG: ACT domain-containing protein [Pirellulales bacterium]|nr:ACT domain-containing protein [Pirellulales bacterium]
MRLTLLVGEYSIVRLAATATLPEWTQAAIAVNSEMDFACVARTSDELSIVCTSLSVDESTAEKVEAGWRTFRVSGQLDFDQVGIVAGLSQPLAAEGIPLFCVSTFDTDYILVKERDLEHAQQVWTNAGHQVDASLA